jgi:ketosteroid isomerase-like protein
MAKITVSEDCGNAPKKQFILDFNIAFANGDMVTVLDCLTNDITWEIVGKETVVGKDAVAQLLNDYYETANELVIFNILSHFL